MSIKDKLGKLIRIINNYCDDYSKLSQPVEFSINKQDKVLTDDKLDDIVWNLIKEINNEQLDYIKYFETNTEIKYQDFTNVWYNFIKRNVLEIRDENFVGIIDEINKSSLKISLFENELSNHLEQLFNTHINSIEDDLLIFYIKGSDNILIMYKSYEPLLTIDDVRLPFWEYIIEHSKIKSKFDNVFTKKNNLCIIGFSI